MKKKFLLLFTMLFTIFGLASCDENKADINLPSEGDKGEVTPGEDKPSTPSEGDKGEVTPGEDKPSIPIVLNETNIYVVGDSTVCDYSVKSSDGTTTITDKTYFYDRFGYGTQLTNYLSKKANVINLALSGRSSKSFVKEDNYNTLKQSIKAGDYLIVGFGHNDEKSDDAERFASANGSLETVGSFKYNLYEYYVKLALEKGATPIICSPIVRLDSKNEYNGSTAHITADGDYAKAIRELGSEVNVTTIDLTTLTKNLYQSVGYDEAVYFHAMTSGIDSSTANTSSVDKTHLNIYGAKMVSYLFMNELKNTECELKNYINDDISKPTKEKDLVKNSLFKYVDYTPINVNEYKNEVNSNEKLEHFKNTSSDWFGTAFGDIGGSQLSKDNGYVGYEENNTFIVGQGNSTGSTKYKGKLASASEGRGYVLQQISIDKNFIIEADGVVQTFNTDASKQTGFGLVLRDECYASTTDSLKDASLGLGNSYNAGLTIQNSGSSICNFARISGSLVNSKSTIANYQEGTQAHFKIERVGQIVKCSVTYNGNTYTEVYTDVDLVAKDSKYMYVGMFGARGTIAKFSNVNLTITGESQGA